MKISSRIKEGGTIPGNSDKNGQKLVGMRAKARQLRQKVGAHSWTIGLHGRTLHPLVSLEHRSQDNEDCREQPAKRAVQGTKRLSKFGYGGPQPPS